VLQPIVQSESHDRHRAARKWSAAGGRRFNVDAPPPVCKGSGFLAALPAPAAVLP